MHFYGDHHGHVSDHGRDDRDGRDHDDCDHDDRDHDHDARGHDANVYHENELHNILYVFSLALNLPLIIKEFNFNGLLHF